MDRTLEDTFYIAFTTRAFATGIPTVLAGTPVVSAYEDAGLTQITAGITLGVDHDSVAGFNMLTIVAAAASGYEAGKDYNLVITTGTVGGVSVVGEVVGTFSLGLDASFTRLGAQVGASISADIAAVKAETVLIVADTNELQSDDVPTLIATAQADLDTITDTDGVILGAAGVDLIWDEVLTGATHNVNNSSGKRLRALSGSIFSDGTAQSGGNNSIQLEASAVTIDDQYRRSKVVIVGGTGAGQEAIITSSVAATD